MDFFLRLYEKSDLVSLGTISVSDEYKGQHLQIAMSLQNADAKFERCFVATVDSQIVGYIYGYIVPKKMSLPQFLYVKKENRGRGIGTALLRKFEEESHTPCCIIYYRKELHSYYKKQGYLAGTTEVAMKMLPVDEEIE